LIARRSANKRRCHLAGSAVAAELDPRKAFENLADIARLKPLDLLGSHRAGRVEGVLDGFSNPTCGDEDRWQLRDSGARDRRQQAHDQAATDWTIHADSPATPAALLPIR